MTTLSDGMSEILIMSTVCKQPDDQQCGHSLIRWGMKKRNNQKHISVHETISNDNLDIEIVKQELHTFISTKPEWQQDKCY